MRDVDDDIRRGYISQQNCMACFFAPVAGEVCRECVWSYNDGILRVYNKSNFVPYDTEVDLRLAAMLVKYGLERLI